jgi:adenine-specific DNA-methyltransferase
MKLAHPPLSSKVYTPTDLAEAIVRVLGDQPGAMWLEPSHGKGVFIEAIARLGVRRERITAIDLDCTPSHADTLATTFRGVDFLRWALETDKKFDRIVGNPPFVAIRALPVSLQASAISVPDLSGRPIGRRANLWYVFVLASLRLLKCGGSLAFVLPAAAEFTNYSEPIRRLIGQKFNRLELYRCERPLFEGVQEGTLVAVARGYELSPCMVRRRRFGSREGLVRGLLEGDPINGHKCPPRNSRCITSTIKLDSVAGIHLGGVTGHAEYFLMNEEGRQSRGLPLAALTPVVSKAKHLRFVCLDMENWKTLKSSGERIWLFNPPAQMLQHPNVRSYLELDVADGGCNRNAFKISIRDPWYRTPLPARPDAFLSGMSQYGPWLCINEMQALNATNTLYVVTFQQRNRELWYAWALALLSSTAQHQIRRLGRRYADGLIKYEPGPLGQIELPILKSNVDHKLLHENAINALLAGDLRTSKAIADSAIV